MKELFFNRLKSQTRLGEIMVFSYILNIFLAKPGDRNSKKINWLKVEEFFKMEIFRELERIYSFKIYFAGIFY